MHRNINVRVGSVGHFASCPDASDAAVCGRNIHAVDFSVKIIPGFHLPPGFIGARNILLAGTEFNGISDEFSRIRCSFYSHSTWFIGCAPIVAKIAKATILLLIGKHSVRAAAVCDRIFDLCRTIFGFGIPCLNAPPSRRRKCFSPGRFGIGFTTMPKIVAISESMGGINRIGLFRGSKITFFTITRIAIINNDFPLCVHVTFAYQNDFGAHVLQKWNEILIDEHGIGDIFDNASRAFVRTQTALPVKTTAPSADDTFSPSVSARYENAFSGQSSAKGELFGASMRSFV